MLSLATTATTFQQAIPMHAGTGCEQSWRTVRKEEGTSPVRRHVWMPKRQAQLASANHKRAMLQESDLSSRKGDPSELKRRSMWPWKMIFLKQVVLLPPVPVEVQESSHGQ